jgi:hypothetical protein
MKNLLKFSLAIVFALGWALQGYSQFTTDTKLVSAGVSFGLYGEKYNKEKLLYKRSATIPVYIQLEKGMSEGSPFAEYSKYLTSGFYIGANTQSLSLSLMTVDQVAYEQWIDYTFIGAGLLLSGHYTELLEEMDISLDPNIIDLYLSVKIGLAMVYTKTNFDGNLTEIEISTNQYEFKDNKTYFYMAPVIGARYYITKKLALQAEFGYFNFGKASVGVTVKL